MNYLVASDVNIPENAYIVLKVINLIKTLFKTEF